MSQKDLVLVVFPLIAAMLHVLGFWRYYSQTEEGVSKPNFLSWAIWAFSAILNALTFMAITSVVVAAQTIVGSFGCTTIFVVALVKGKFEWPNWKEWMIFVFCIFAIVVWKIFNPLFANLLITAAIALSFWPSWEGVWRVPAKEKKLLPWYLWGVAWAVTAISVFLFGGVTLRLAMPIFLSIAHLAIPAICAYRKK